MARISYNATTNSQGVANANITGQGLGKLKFIGKVDDIWSNTIEIEDYLFYDKAVTGQKNTNWISIRLDAVVTDEAGTLLNNVKYTVKFNVWPSQYTYDLIAKYNNSTAGSETSYENEDANIKKYLIQNPDGSYTLKTNTGSLIDLEINQLKNYIF